MKKITFLLAALIMILASCSKDSEGLHALLSHVPADASMVGAVNIKSTFEKSGSKISGNKVELSPELKKFLSSSPQSAQMISLLQSGNHGLKIDWIGFFAIGGKTYIFGPIDNEKNFKSSIEKETHSKFTESDGVQSADNWAICDGYFWTSTSKLPADRVKDFSSLSESKSWAAKKYVEVLEEEKSDIFTICATSEISSLLGGSMQAQMISMGANLMFNDLSYIALNIECDKEDLEININLLDSSSSPAEYLLPAQKVNTELIKDISADASAVVAFSIPAQLVDKFSTILDMAGAEAAALKNIDGTIAMASSNGKANLVIQLKDAVNTHEIQNLVTNNIGRNAATDKIVNNNIYFSCNEDTPSDATPIANPASYFKDAIGGAVLNASYFSLPSFNLFSAMLTPKGKSLVLKCKFTNSKSSQNSIVTLMNDISADFRNEI